MVIVAVVMVVRSVLEIVIVVVIVEQVLIVADRQLATLSLPNAALAYMSALKTLRKVHLVFCLL